MTDPPGPPAVTMGGFMVVLGAEISRAFAPPATGWSYVFRLGNDVVLKLKGKKDDLFVCGSAPKRMPASTLFLKGKANAASTS